MQQMLDFWCFSFFNFYFVFGLVWFGFLYLFFLSLRANINEKETHQGVHKT